MDDSGKAGRAGLEELDSNAIGPSTRRQSSATPQEYPAASLAADPNVGSANGHKENIELAKRRGGARTALGKEKTKRNAVKHGIFSKSVLLEKEPREEFDALLDGLRADFQPVGTLEGLLVEKLASLTWRYRRMLRAERADIEFESRFECSDDERNREEAMILFKSLEKFGPGLASLANNPIIGARCEELLQSLKTMIEGRGFEPTYDLKLIGTVYGDNFRNPLVAIYVAFSSGGPSAKQFDLPPEERKAKFLEVLQEEIDWRKHLGEVLAGRSAIKNRRKAKRSQVPEPTKTDRLLRYATALDRAFDKTLNQLERIQRIRHGEPVLPPLDVRLST